MTIAQRVFPGDRAASSSITPFERLVAEARMTFAGGHFALHQGVVVNAWDSATWDLTHLVDDAQSSGNRRLYFREYGPNGRHTGRMPEIPRHFSDGIKSYVVLQDGIRSVPGLANRVNAARHLWRAILRGRGGDASRFTWSSLRAGDLSALEALLHHNGDGEGSPKSVRALCNHAIGVVQWLQSEAGVVPPFDWSPTAPHPSRERRYSRVAREANARKRLPSRKVLRELARYYSRTRDADVSDPKALRARVLICAVALCCAGGFRMKELVTLPVDCLHSIIEDGKTKWGIRYFVCKSGQSGAAPRIRWLSPRAAELAVEAVEELVRLTDAWRQQARELERDVSSVSMGNVPPFLERREVMRYCGYSPKTSSTVLPEWLRPCHVAPRSASSVRAVAWYARADVERFLQQQRELSSWKRYRIHFRGGRQAQRPSTRRKGQLLSDTLLVVPSGFYTEHEVHHPFLVLGLDAGQIGGWLTGAGRRRSIFEELDLREPDGSFCRCNVHRLRHWLHNGARKRGMPAHLVALWFQKGQEHLPQYFHDDSDELARKHREGILAGRFDGPLAEAVRSLPEESREGFLAVHLKASHSTPLGICAAHPANDPCEYHAACLDECRHHLVEVGNQEQFVQISKVRTRSTATKAEYDRRVANGEHVEPSQLAHVDRTIRGCDAALQRIEGVGEAPGTVVHVSPGGEDRFHPYDFDGR